MYMVMWLVLFLLFVIIELSTMSLTTIWFAGGAAVAFILSLFRLPFMIQAIFFIIVSILLLAATRPLAVKYVNNKVVKTNVESLIGKEAQITKAIEEHNKGVAVVNGQEWSAESKNGKEIKEGSIVNISDIKGVTLIVKEKFRED